MKALLCLFVVLVVMGIAGFFAVSAGLVIGGNDPYRVALGTCASWIVINLCIFLFVDNSD